MPFSDVVKGVVSKIFFSFQSDQIHYPLLVPQGGMAGDTKVRRGASRKHPFPPDRREWCTPSPKTIGGVLLLLDIIVDKLPQRSLIYVHYLKNVIQSEPHLSDALQNIPQLLTSNSERTKRDVTA